MAHPQETRDLIRKAYVFNGLSMEIAAAQAGVSFVTARRWKKESADKGDDWDKQRSAHMMAGGGLEDVSRALLFALVIQFKTLMDEVNNTEGVKLETRVDMLASLTDAYNKSISASKRILPETSQLATALEVVQSMGTFIAEKYPQHLPVFAEVLEPFGDVIEKSYG